MVGNIIEIASAVGQLAGAVNSTAKLGTSVVDSKRALMSISEKARQSVMMYKVWMSAGIRETELAQHIGKWLENMYSIFTMLVLGFNPMAKDNGEIQNIIGGISAESLKPEYNNKDQTEAFNKAMVTMDSERKTSSPRIGRGYKSTEAFSGGESGSGKSVEETKFVDYMKSLDTKSYPTIINMKVKAGNGLVNIPIAVKCNIYPMGIEETRLLIESGISGKMFDYLRKIKWRSGEISTLAWIFNTDIAEKNKELYEKLGRNPMFMELQQRKAASKRSFWGKFLSRFGSEFAVDEDDKAAYKQINAAIANVPPTSSLIVSKDDLVAATRLNIEHFTKNDGFVNRFMKDNFLLCLGIVDHASQEFTCFIMGYKQPFKMSFDELTKAYSQGQDKTLAESIKILATKV